MLRVPSNSPDRTARRPRPQRGSYVTVTPPPDVITRVIVIHGTFARRAEWPEPEGSLGTWLRSVLGEETEVRAFRWSGGNSLGARMRAALALRKEIGKAEPTDRQVVTVLLGHSHGGNVALVALNDPDVARRVSGVACLGTPFAIPEPRDPRGATIVVPFALAALACAIATGGLPTEWSLILSIIGGIAYAWISRSLGEAIESAIVRRAAEYAACVGPPQDIVVPVFSARVEGDEAHAWLRALQLIWRLPTTLQNVPFLAFSITAAYVTLPCLIVARLIYPYDGSDPRLGLFLLAGATLTVLASTLLLRIPPRMRAGLAVAFAAFTLAAPRLLPLARPPNVGNPGALLLGISLALPALVSIAFLAASLALLILVDSPLRASPLALGLGFRDRPFSIRWRVTDRPPHYERVTEVVGSLRTAKGLRHSRARDDPRVLRALGRWLIAVRRQAFRSNTAARP